MAITHAAGTRTGIASAVAADIGASGKFKILNAAGTALCTITLSTLAVAAGGINFLGAATSASAAVTTSGTASKYTITTGADAVILTGSASSVGTTGKDINLTEALTLEAIKAVEQSVVGEGGIAQKGQRFGKRAGEGET